MRRNPTIAVLLAGFLLAAAAQAQAQQLVTSPVPLSAHVLYEVPDTTAADATPILYVDDAPFLVLSKICTVDQTPRTCDVVPEPVFFTVINRAPFPHRLDAAVQNASGTSVKASQVRVTPPQPPAPTMCMWVTLQGVLTPKPIGNDDVRGWNPIDTSDPASVRAFYARNKQLRAWGLDATVLAMDDGVHVALGADGKPVHPITGKPWAYIYAPCVGPPQ